MEEKGFDKRAFLAIGLAIIVLVAFQYFFVSSPPPPQQQPPPSTPEKAPAEPIRERPEDIKRDTVPYMQPAEEKGDEQTITIETNLYKATVSSRGAAIKTWQLKQYLDKEEAGVILMRSGERIPPLALGMDDAFTYRDVIFSLGQAAHDISLKGANEEASLTFVYRTDSLFVKRTFTFHSDDYSIGLEDEVSGIESYWVTLGNGFGMSGAEEGYGAHIGPVVLKNADREEINPSKVKEPLFFREGLKWIAQEDKYFFAGIVPLGSVNTAKVWRTSNGEVLAGLNVPEGKQTFVLYAGPKEHDRLKTLGVGLEHIIDFGFFSILSRPLFWIMKVFYSYMGNYGWAIVLLTIVVRIPFIPLINKGQKSMKKMQALQPRMTEIRQKYKKDAPKMQKEMTELYKKYKVNPMSGCLPMLVQIPVFFALYKVLLIAIELRDAPFMFWIQDLSEKDPYYILPIIMGATMFLQQKMTPTTVDSQQQKIMQFLPIIFTFLFLNFPSGLVLYWLVSNLLSIVQQYYVNRKLEKEGASK
jgi:YidC/Oxa1 family membrane protein insertase